jgi:hypothetical protein
VGAKRPGREADHSPPSSVKVEECVELYLHSPNTVPWRGADLKAQGQLYLYLYLYVQYGGPVNFLGVTSIGATPGRNTEYSFCDNLKVCNV